MLFHLTGWYDQSKSNCLWHLSTFYRTKNFRTKYIYQSLDQFIEEWTITLIKKYNNHKFCPMTFITKWHYLKKKSSGNKSNRCFAQSLTSKHQRALINCRKVAMKVLSNEQYIQWSFAYSFYFASQNWIKLIITKQTFDNQQHQNHWIPTEFYWLIKKF